MHKTSTQPQIHTLTAPRTTTPRIFPALISLSLLLRISLSSSSWSSSLLRDQSLTISLQPCLAGCCWIWIFAALLAAVVLVNVVMLLLLMVFPCGHGVRRRRGVHRLDWQAHLYPPFRSVVRFDPEIVSLVWDGYLCKLSAAAGIDVTVQAKR